MFPRSVEIPFLIGFNNWTELNLDASTLMQVGILEGVCKVLVS